jgi:chemotaxis response regulator CheB
MAKTILIVDDNAYIRLALCEQFKRESDFEICGEAANGKEAIAKALELHPDLIVLDLLLKKSSAKPETKFRAACRQPLLCDHFRLARHSGGTRD